MDFLFAPDGRGIGELEDDSFIGILDEEVIYGQLYGNESCEYTTRRNQEMADDHESAIQEFPRWKVRGEGFSYISQPTETIPNMVHNSFISIKKNQ